MHLTALEEAEIISDKDYDTRIKSLALTNGHGHYITVTVHPNGRSSVKYIAVNFLSVSLPKPPFQF